MTASEEHDPGMSFLPTSAFNEQRRVSNIRPRIPVFRVHLAAIMWRLP